MNNFVGRSEPEVETILRQIIGPCTIWPQYPISKIISVLEMEFLGKEHNQHKFDFYIEFSPGEFLPPKKMVVEVNFKHGDGASRKWLKVYKPFLDKYGIIGVTVDDFDCRERGIFWHNSEDRHPKITWDDYRDIIDALEKAGIEPKKKD